MHASGEGEIHAAIAVCRKFIERTSYLDDAFFTALGDVEDRPTVVKVIPEHFDTNDAYRELFALVLEQQLRPRTWKHTVILWQYKNILISRALHDFVLLHTPADSEHRAACQRWASWEVVAMRWPFDILGQTRGVGYFEYVCRAMWTRLREVAVAALDEEEARVGPCVFDVMAERGVIRGQRAAKGGMLQPERAVVRVRAVIRQFRARIICRG